MNIADSRSKFNQVEILSEGLSLLPVRCIFIIIFSNWQEHLQIDCHHTNASSSFAWNFLLINSSLNFAFDKIDFLVRTILHLMMKSDKETLSSGELEIVTTILANYSYIGVRTQQTNRAEQNQVWSKPR